MVSLGQVGGRGCLMEAVASANTLHFPASKCLYSPKIQRRHVLALLPTMETVAGAVLPARCWDHGDTYSNPEMKVHASVHTCVCIHVCMQVYVHAHVSENVCALHIDRHTPGSPRAPGRRERKKNIWKNQRRPMSGKEWQMSTLGDGWREGGKEEGPRSRLNYGGDRGCPTGPLMIQVSKGARK